MPKKSVQETVQKEMPEFADAVSHCTLDELDGRLAELAKHLDATEQAKEADEDLAKAQEDATAKGAPYRDAKKAIKLKSRYIIELIKEKGGK